MLEDYLLTSQFFDRSCELILSEGGAELFTAVDRTIWEPLMRVHPDYLTAMFDHLDVTYGSVDHYLRDQLGIDAVRIDRLRAHLLE